MNHNILYKQYRKTNSCAKSKPKKTITEHFGPKTLWYHAVRHQDISALVRGHFGITAERH